MPSIAPSTIYLTFTPSILPSLFPTLLPSTLPSGQPSKPTVFPTFNPSPLSSIYPSGIPFAVPSVLHLRNLRCFLQLSHLIYQQSSVPSIMPSTHEPSVIPSLKPTVSPSALMPPLDFPKILVTVRQQLENLNEVSLKTNEGQSAFKTAVVNSLFTNNIQASDVLIIEVTFCLNLLV